MVEVDSLIMVSIIFTLGFVKGTKEFPTIGSPGAMFGKKNKGVILQHLFCKKHRPEKNKPTAQPR